MRLILIFILSIYLSSIVLAQGEGEVGSEGFIATVDLMAITTEPEISKIRSMDLLTEPETTIEHFSNTKNKITKQYHLYLYNGSCRFNTLHCASYATEGGNGEYDLVSSRYKEGVLIDLTYSVDFLENTILLMGEVGVAELLKRKEFTPFPKLNAGEPIGDVGGSAIFNGLRPFRLGQKYLISTYKFGNKHKDIDGIGRVAIVTLVIEPFAQWNGTLSDISINQGADKSSLLEQAVKIRGDEAVYKMIKDSDF